MRLTPLQSKIPDTKSHEEINMTKTKGVLFLLTVMNLCLSFQSRASTPISDTLVAHENRSVQELQTDPRPPAYCRLLADLAVTDLPDPIWDSTRGLTLIQVVIHNSGASTQERFDVKLETDGNSYTIFTNPIASGATRVITFTVPGSIYNPDAHYKATVNSQGLIKECNQKNNSKSFFGLG